MRKNRKVTAKILLQMKFGFSSFLLFILFVFSMTLSLKIKIKLIMCNKNLNELIRQKKNSNYCNLYGKQNLIFNVKYTHICTTKNTFFLFDSYRYIFKQPCIFAFTFVSLLFFQMKVKCWKTNCIDQCVV